jgi:outer membrane receptor for ferrienterochelin and colicin
MDPVLVTARQNYALEKVGFTQRQKTAWGSFFTHDEIVKRNAQRLTDMLRDVPGMTIRSGVLGSSVADGRQTAILSRGRAPMGGGSCPRIFVDGTEWRAVEPGDLDNFVFPSEVVGMEVYARGHAPAQWRGIDECSVIVVWTQSQNVVTVR